MCLLISKEKIVIYIICDFIFWIVRKLNFQEFPLVNQIKLSFQKYTQPAMILNDIFLNGIQIRDI